VGIEVYSPFVLVPGEGETDDAARIVTLAVSGGMGGTRKLGDGKGGIVDVARHGVVAFGDNDQGSGAVATEAGKEPEVAVLCNAQSAGDGLAGEPFGKEVGKVIMVGDTALPPTVEGKALRDGEFTSEPVSGIRELHAVSLSADDDADERSSVPDTQAVSAHGRGSLRTLRRERERSRPRAETIWRTRTRSRPAVLAVAPIFTFMKLLSAMVESPSYHTDVDHEVKDGS
jgi:hypothetical protein